VAGFNLFAPTLNAQIKIEERVEIKPENNKIITNNPVLSHTITVNMQWTPGNGYALGFFYRMPCEVVPNGTSWLGGGSLTFTIDDIKSGIYGIEFWFNVPFYQLVTAQYQLYFDGELYQSDTFTIYWEYWIGRFPNYASEFISPLASDFTVAPFFDEVCSLFSDRFDIAADFTPDCEGMHNYVNYKTEPFYASITSGGEYASFYKWNTSEYTWDNIGNSFSSLINEINNIIIEFDNPYLGIEDTYIVIQCEWGDKIKTYSIRLKSSLAAQVEVENDEVTSGGILDVYLQAKNSTGDCDGFFSSPDVTYSLEIISGNQYGNLINPFTNEKSQSIGGLEQIDGYSYFFYAADGISADDTVEAVVRISTSEPNFPYLDHTIYIKPSPIYVQIVPEVLGADDTADVIIKKRNPDGTLVDFPSNQTFELAVLDGCVNGNFMVGGVIDVYFAAA
jgi:hypothetical protein